jgi:hypothetical protein
MKTALKIALIVCVFGLMMFSVKPVKAQCAQCAAAVESSSKNGSQAANGLNSGIIYLLLAPYFAVAIGGYVWYRNYKKKDVKLDIRSEKLHLN